MDMSRLLLGGEIHERRSLPTPALWNALVTIVPEGAPSSAISRATLFVDDNSR
jgi:hypothetical protein